VQSVTEYTLTPAPYKAPPRRLRAWLMVGDVPALEMQGTRAGITHYASLYPYTTLTWRRPSELPAAVVRINYLERKRRRV
jgi:hypothetical protein